MFEYSLVVPVYNESEIINDFYEELLRVMEATRKNFEIIFVTGGNTDDTLNILKNISQSDKRVKIVNMSHRFDYQAALTAGLDYSSGKAVITMDGDLQHPPQVIPSLIKEWENGYDIVYTIRDDTLGESLLKKISSQSFYFVLKLLTNIDFEKNCADFRLLSRKAVESFKRFPERKRYIPGIISTLGFKKTGVRYICKKRDKGKSKFNYRRMLSLAIDGIFSFSIIPVRIITFLGLVMTFFSIIYLIFIVFWSILNPDSIGGWASILSTILILSSFQILFLGIVGEYIGRIYEETKQRPLYIVDELIGFDKNE